MPENEQFEIERSEVAIVVLIVASVFSLGMAAGAALVSFAVWVL